MYITFDSYKYLMMIIISSCNNNDSYRVRMIHINQATTNDSDYGDINSDNDSMIV